MVFTREASVAVALVTLTLSLQCAGMAALISWGRTSLAPDVHRLEPIRSALLIVRLMIAFISLHRANGLIQRLVGKGSFCVRISVSECTLADSRG